MWDSLQLATMMYLMQAISNSDFEREGPVRTVDSEGNPNAFEFTVLDNDEMPGGRFRVTVERVEG